MKPITLFLCAGINLLLVSCSTGEQATPKSINGVYVYKYVTDLLRVSDTIRIAPTTHDAQYMISRKAMVQVFTNAQKKTTSFVRLRWLASYSTKSKQLTRTAYPSITLTTGSILVGENEYKKIQ